ncbi:MAG: hypothetical protein AW07_02578 [Candidatus Accumulibacter sp. SK-11]|nr:MAG: hypothetical protein AW07_02578 [Candidatus Accumulibacter sp. SK-11]
MGSTSLLPGGGLHSRGDAQPTKTGCIRTTKQLEQNPTHPAHKKKATARRGSSSRPGSQTGVGSLPAAEALSIHRLIRLASPMRVCLPAESRRTMTTGLSATRACITRHLPAS